MSSAARRLAVGATGAVGTVLGLVLTGRTTRWLGPVRVQAGILLDPAGGVRLHVPPLGTASVPTHGGPLRVDVRAVDVDPARAQALLQYAEKGSAEARAQVDAAVSALRTRLGADARGLGRALATRSALAGVGGAAALAAFGLRRPAAVAGAVATSAAVLGAGAAVAAATVDRDAWREPRLDGLLEQAPLILGDLRTAPERLGSYRDQLADLLRTGTDVYRRVASLPAPPPQDAIRLLHVSDIHLSPLAYPLAAALVERYDVDAVVDTGDLVDWGTPAEQAFAGQIAGLNVPYLYVKGNHDSVGIAAAVGRQPNATALDVGAGPVDIAGLRFAGMADPRFTPDKTTGDDHAEHRVSRAALEFAAAVKGRKVDIALAHDPAVGRALAGTVPLLLAGHTHRRAAHRFGDTTVLVQGTSGGSGLRGVQEDPPTPVSLSIVYIERGSRRLWGVDEVTLGGLGAVSLSVVRRSAAELVGSADTA